MCWLECGGYGQQWKTAIADEGNPEEAPPQPPNSKADQADYISMSTSLCAELILAKLVHDLVIRLAASGGQVMLHPR